MIHNYFNLFMYTLNLSLCFLSYLILEMLILHLICNLKCFYSSNSNFKMFLKTYQNLFTIIYINLSNHILKINLVYFLIYIIYIIYNIYIIYYIYIIYILYIYYIYIIYIIYYLYIIYIYYISNFIIK